MSATTGAWVWAAYFWSCLLHATSASRARFCCDNKGQTSFRCIWQELQWHLFERLYENWSMLVGEFDGDFASVLSLAVCHHCRYWESFFQIGVCKEDWDVHHFLWDADGDIKIMRFRRVLLGNCSSPFLLNATVQSHLASFPASEVLEELQENMYVDDFLSGADSIDEYCSMVQESSDIMSKASMNLVNWGSNSPDVSRMLQCVSETNSWMLNITRFLVWSWLPEMNVSHFKGGCPYQQISVWPREWYSATFPDCLIPWVHKAICFTHQVSVSGTMVFRIRLGWWGAPWIPTRVLSLDGWNWCSEEAEDPMTSCPWSEIQHLELHGFGDASPKGYGVCVYLVEHLGDGSSASSLIMSKSNVAPLKKVTLPRLELLGSLLCARLIVFVREALKLPNDVKMTCWTDSMISLSWIRSTPTRWMTFCCQPCVWDTIIDLCRSVVTLSWCRKSCRSRHAGYPCRGSPYCGFMAQKSWLMVKALWTILMLQETWRHRCLRRQLMWPWLLHHDRVSQCSQWKDGVP